VAKHIGLISNQFVKENLFKELFAGSVSHGFRQTDRSRMSKIAYFECFSGASGNMILGALLDAGLPLSVLEAELKKLQVAGFALQVQRVDRQGIAATHVTVVTEETHAHRHLHHITAIIEKSALPDRVKADSQRIFTRLAEAEAKIHNTTVEHIHFHEVGALDAIVDIVGAVIGLHYLGVDTIYVSPFSQGTGFTICDHGKIPIPAPATVELLKGKPVRQTEIEAELTTPTGAAILSTLGTHFGVPPIMAFDAVGYGAGTKELSIPNVLRLSLGAAAANADAYDHDAVVVIEANIDDMNPELYGYIFEQAFAAGALDVFTTPVMMKKNRPGTLLTVLAPPDRKSQVIDLMLKETTTLGVRWQEQQRTKAQREIRMVETPYGPVHVKIARRGIAILHVAPEYEDCKQLAQTHPGVALQQIYQEALQRALQLAT
jgi:pyridinium-3,5-bisthiocarboxylic acid mononucleotide nickel chelatase